MDKVFSYVKNNGDYNHLPSAPMEEISISDFWHKWFLYSTIESEHRQVYLDSEKKDGVPQYRQSLHTCRILWYHDCAIVIFRPNRDGDTPKVFRLGCKHEFKTTKSQMCYREYECTKCGLKDAVDSSD